MHRVCLAYKERLQQRQPLPESAVWGKQLLVRLLLVLLSGVWFLSQCHHRRKWLQQQQQQQWWLPRLYSIHVSVPLPRS